ncbi:PQQ-binding-like beta-propeller repeat protein [Glycomyces paridis]|uniref:Pyrrolo-quinoline quinone repeat domain-containing protein n=1 Tax=Glycomyces paridis TaxID=2126555 RepID=A0A4S8PL64_9ACTN|nr:PQQ-binding-like beta-propeller repeat protein [Glycomyces paridis]THV30831.1 hypothetical protein E9998_05500 [Glycomyces paridis]
METDADRTTLWRELRGWPRSVQVGVAVAAGAVFASAFVIEPFYSHDLPDESAWAEGDLPDHLPVGTVEAPSEEPGAPEGVGPYDGEPLWTTAVEEETDQVAHVDQGLLRLSDGRFTLERDGAEVWSHEWEGYGPAIGVAGDVVVFSERVDDFADEDYEWPGRQDTVALDLDTGDEVWRDREASFVTVFADAVLMTECTGEQQGRIGDCTLHSRDPADLSLQWSTPTYASARSLDGGDWTGEPVPDRLLFESFPNGHEDRTVTVYEDGDALVTVETDAGADLAGDTLVLYDDYDENPADDCTATLTGYRFGDAEPDWEVEAATRKNSTLSSCGGLPATGSGDGLLPLTLDGVPSVLDAATGEAVWEAPGEGQAIAVGPDALVVAAWEDGAGNLVAYDTVSGEERWRASTNFGSGGRATILGDTLWLYGDASMWGWSTYEVYAYDLASGEGAALPGSSAYFAPGAIVMRSGGYDDPVLTAWPTRIW